MVAPVIAAALLPILTQLAQNGLGLVANAIMAKGKQVVEDKLGVNIETAVQSEEGRLKLLQSQNDHEEFLIQAALDNRKVDLDFYKEDAADRQSARDMEARVQESEHASWLSKNIVAILALIVVIGGGAGIVYSPDADVRLGLTSIVTLVLGFYFGTSSSSRGKDATNASLAHALARGQK